MNAQHDNTGPNGPFGRWMSPPRSGMRRVIAPWEYRHLRGFARLRVAAGAALVGLSFVTLVGGSLTTEAVAWAVPFLMAGVANLAYAAWELNIARSQSAHA